MFEFVNWLRAVAAALITNSHYADIWPISSLAFGGHIGNCLYFFLSGFCLFNIKESFPKWYLKRIIRIYPALWIVNTIDLISGRTHIGEFMGFVHCYFYPTWFHFIGSIMLLYAVYYCVRVVQKKFRIDIKWFMALSLVLYLVIYVCCFDKSVYHIDDVNEKWVRFMFFESMLMGAWLREKYDTINSKISVMDIGLFGAFTIIYLVGKIAFSSISRLSIWQCFLPIILLVYIYSIAMLFIKLEKKKCFDTVSKKLNIAISFIAGITLEIYLGQHLIIWAITDLVFPISFVVVSFAIIVYAWLIHRLSQLIQNGVSKLVERI